MFFWTRSPHKDSKTRNIQTSGDILPVPARKKAILGLGVRFKVRVIIGVQIRFGVRNSFYGLGLRLGSPWPM
jgi:hypothetical protein